MKNIIILIAAYVFSVTILKAQTHGQDVTSPLDIWPSTRYYQAMEIGNSNRLFLGGRSSLAPISWGAYPDNNTGVGLGVYRYAYTNAPTSRICFANWANGSLNFDFSDDVNINQGDVVTWKTRLNIQKDGQMDLNGSMRILEPSGLVNFKVDNSGHLWARQVKVLVGTIPDYVFHPQYDLMTLSQVEEYINVNKHLPNIPSADEYSKMEGIDVGELQLKLLEKVEELTLYMIQLNKDNQLLRKEIDCLKAERKDD